MTLWMLEVTGGIDLAGTTKTWRMSNARDPITGFPDAEARLLTPANIERHAFGKGSVTGPPQVDYGTVEANNADGGLDGMVMAGLDGWPITLWKGPDSATKKDDFAPYLIGTAEDQGYDNGVNSIALRNRQAEIAGLPLSTERYLGDNVSPDGVEGTEDDLGGQYKPIWLGWGENVPVPMVNTVKMILQLSSNGTVPITGNAPQTVYDSGDPLGFPKVEKTTWAAFTHTTGPVAEVWWYFGPEGWYIRLPGSPAGTITVTAQEGTTATSTAAQLTSRILTAHGVPANDIRGAAALDGLNPETIGFWSGTSEVRIGDALASILSGAVATWTDDRLGIFTLARLEEPALTPDHVFEDWQLFTDGGGSEGFRLIGGGEPGSPIPASEAVVKYRRNWQVQTGDDLDGAATDARRAFAAQEYRATTALETGASVKHRLAKPYERQTLLSLLSDAESLRQRLATLFGVRRFIVQIDLPPDDAFGVCLFDTVSIPIGRFDFNTRNFRVIGVVDQIGGEDSKDFTTLILWG